MGNIEREQFGQGLLEVKRRPWIVRQETPFMELYPKRFKM